MKLDSSTGEIFVESYWCCELIVTIVFIVLTTKRVTDYSIVLALIHPIVTAARRGGNGGSIWPNLKSNWLFHRN